MACAKMPVRFFSGKPPPLFDECIPPTRKKKKERTHTLTDVVGSTNPICRHFLFYS